LEQTPYNRIGRKTSYSITAAMICVFIFTQRQLNSFPVPLCSVGSLVDPESEVWPPFDTLAESSFQLSQGKNVLAIEYFWRHVDGNRFWLT
jgi:hypothetical protein